MDILLTQLYGMIMILNMFGIIVAACVIYNMEFAQNAIKKMYMLPIKVQHVYLCKFLIMSAGLFGAILIQNIALACIGINSLPEGTFSMEILLSFGGYSFLTAMPVLSFMTLVSSKSCNMWTCLGIGVAGFLTAMSLANVDMAVVLLHPFVIMLKPAVAMSARIDIKVAAVALLETILFILCGYELAKKFHYE